MTGTCNKCGGTTTSPTIVRCLNCIDNIMSEYKKPPLGVMPRDIFLEKRCIDIVKAISAYYQFDGRLPEIEWVEELNELLTEINKPKS